MPRKSDIEEIQPNEIEASEELEQDSVNQDGDETLPQRQALIINLERALFRPNFNFRSISDSVAEDNSFEQSFDFAEKGYPEGSSLDGEPGDLISDSSGIISDAEDGDLQLAIQESLRGLSFNDELIFSHGGQEILNKSSSRLEEESLEGAKYNKPKKNETQDDLTDDDVVMCDAESHSPKESPRRPNAESSAKSKYTSKQL